MDPDAKKRIANRRAPKAKKPPVVQKTHFEEQPSSLVLGMTPEQRKESQISLSDDLLAKPKGLRKTFQRETLSEKSIKQKKDLPVLEITDISYHVMSHEELKNAAVFTVLEAKDSGDFSVNDPRGGVVDKFSSCVTCDKDQLECPGHLGIIVLNEHIIHPLMRKEVINILSSVCGSCGELLLSEQDMRDKGVLELTGTSRLKKLREKSAKVPCRKRHEGVSPCRPNPEEYAFDTENYKIKYRYHKKDPFNFMSISEVEKILDSISDEDARLMGFENESHPRRMIMKSIPVIPQCARPTSVQDGNVFKDSLTEIYLDIVRKNIELKDPNFSEKTKDQIIKTLNFYIDHMINNTDKRYAKIKTRPHLSLQERIQGKEGLIRQSLMGKRVDYSARSVISPDPTLKFGQIRVPLDMAPVLTPNEIVGPENIRKLTIMLKNGKITHVIPKNGKMAGKRLKINEKNKNEMTLQIGDTVSRWLENGDFVVYNRQPTLHKQGIMGYEVVLRDAPNTWNTFGTYKTA